MAASKPRNRVTVQTPMNSGGSWGYQTPIRPKWNFVPN